MRVLPLLGLLVVLLQPAHADEGIALSIADRAAIRTVVEEDGGVELPALTHQKRDPLLE